MRNATASALSSRPHAVPPFQTLRFQHFELQPQERQLLVDHRPVSVGARAFDLLLVLIERRDRVVGKNELLDVVWPGMVVEENNLQVQISTLRKLLGPQVITTIPGRGYRFTETPIGVSEDQAGTGVRSGSPPSSPITATPRSEMSLPTNVPPELTVLYGRDSDLVAIRDLVREHPLVSIIGAPGIGKTRLAEAVARTFIETWPDGVWLVELAPLTDPALVPETVARVLGVSLDAAKPSLTTLVEALRARSLLLVLDNAEHLLDVVADLATGLRRQAPNVRLLITSQELVRAEGEVPYRLATLSVPSAHDLANASSHGAISLFAARAAAALPGFHLSAENVPAVTDICRQLDGLALALELAASRLPILGLAGLQVSLKQRFRLLKGGTRVSLRRHQTLRAALDWSHGLLRPEEQVVFRRLGVFAGGFSLDLARQVAADDTIDPWAVIEHLATLVDKSLVVATATEEPRYSLLENMRAYALEKLAEAGETDAFLRRHALVVAAMCERMLLEQYEHAPDDWLHRHQGELDNVRAALDWACREAADPETAVRIVAHSTMIWRSTDAYVEGRRRWDEAKAVSGDLERLPLALQVRFLLAGASYMSLTPIPTTRERTAAAIERARELGEALWLYRALVLDSEAASVGRDFARARGSLQEARAIENPGWPALLRARALEAESSIVYFESGSVEQLELLNNDLAAIYRAAGDSRQLRSAESVAASIAVVRGDYARAVTGYRAMLGQPRTVEGNVVVLSGLFGALLLQGEIDEAEQVARSIAPRFRGVTEYVCSMFALRLALLLALRQRIEDAARLISFGTRWHERTGWMLDSEDRRFLEETRKRIESELPPPRRAALDSEGKALSEDEMLALIPGASPAASHAASPAASPAARPATDRPSWDANAVR